MLLELRIENLLLIERAELRLGPELNAITGETGAGKTILAHSFDLLMGGKARPQVVRPGAAEAYVEGAFELPEGLLSDPELAPIGERLPEGSGELVIGRRILASGRTSAFLGGRSASAPDLQALGSRLLAFYGQHEHRKLTLSGAQLETLDGFAGAQHLQRRDKYRAAHAEVVRIERELAERTRGTRVELQEIAAELRGYADGIEAEPGRLEQVEERLEALDRLKRKHGGSIEAVLAHAERCRAQIETIEGAGGGTEELEAELAAAARARTDLAAQLSEVRAKSARRLEKRVADELDQLAMSGAKLEVALEPHPDGFGALGQERVTFRVATNPGMPVSPLRDAASGGELSRVMLALAGQGARGGAATYVFDEIDAGIGGNTARAV